MASIKQFGIAGVGSDVQLGKNGGRFVYNSGSGRFDFFASDGATLEDIRVAAIQLGATIQVSSILDEDDFSSDSNTALATQQSIKAYVDTITNSGAMLTAGDSGSGSIVFASETFTLSGNANATVTSFVGTNTFRVSLRNDVNIANTLVVGTTGVGSVQANSFTDGTATLTNGNFTSTGNIDVNAVEFNSLSGTGAITITDILDEDNMVSDSATALATQQSIKAYIDTELSSGGLAMTVAGDSGTGSIVFSSETYNIFGTANQITSTFDGTATLTLSLPDNLTAPSNLTVTNNLTTSLTDTSVPYIGTGGLLTEDNANISFTAATGTLNATLLSFGSLTDGAITIDQFIDENTMLSDLANAVPTQQSVKAYVDTEIAKVDQLTINAGGSTQGNVNWYVGQELTVAGTANEIETGMAGQTLTIGLPDNVTIGNNLTVTGNFLSNDITATTVTIDGEAVVTGNLTVQGTTTIVDSTQVDIADATIRVNSDGSVVNAGLEANIAGVIESILYVPASNHWALSGNVYTDENLTVLGTLDAGGVEFDALSGTGAVSVTDILDEDDLISDSASALATQQSIKAYVDGQIGVTQNDANLEVTADSGTGSINVFNEEFRILGGTNINTEVTDGAGGNVLVVNLDDSVTTGNATITSTLQFATLTDGTTSITDFITEAEGIGNFDNDTSIPTSAAVIDYVANNGGDGLGIRGTFTADSINSNVSIGTTPNVAGRTYYATKVTVSVTTPFSGGSVNHIKLEDNAALTLVAESDTEIASAATYIVEQDMVSSLAKNSPLTLTFLQSNGTTEAVPTAGAVTVTVQYIFAD